MIPKRLLKLVKSLQHKKYRYQERLFLVEGAKSIIELFGSSFTLKTLIGTSVFIDQHKSLIESRFPDMTVHIANESAISAASSFKNNNTGIALVEMPGEASPPTIFSGYVLVLDDVRDPGNLGTIIRIADWYGIKAIVSSAGTTDRFSPKVISASMGSFLRVPFYRTDLLTYLAKVELPVYGSLVGQGMSVHHAGFSPDGLLVLGNESEGVSTGVARYITQAIHIPEYGSAESLNVGVATAVLCDNMRRKLSEKSTTRK